MPGQWGPTERSIGCKPEASGILWLEMVDMVPEKRGLRPCP